MSPGDIKKSDSMTSLMSFQVEGVESSSPYSSVLVSDWSDLPPLLALAVGGVEYSSPP